MGIFKVPVPKNEPVLNYAPGSPERANLVEALNSLKKQQVDIPMIIGGKEVRTADKVKITAPHDHNLVLGYYYKGGKNEVEAAVKAALAAKPNWECMSWESRASVFLKAADLLAAYFAGVPVVFDLPIDRHGPICSFK